MGGSYGQPHVNPHDIIYSPKNLKSNFEMNNSYNKMPKKTQGGGHHAGIGIYRGGR